MYTLPSIWARFKHQNKGPFLHFKIMLIDMQMNSSNWPRCLIAPLLLHWKSWIERKRIQILKLYYATHLCAQNRWSQLGTLEYLDVKDISEEFTTLICYIQSMNKGSNQIVPKATIKKQVFIIVTILFCDHRHPI